MSGQFSIASYGQNPVAMDWFGLADPFTQFFPVNITNNWSGTLAFVGSLTNPPAWYAAYSGVTLGNVGTTNGGNFAMSWNVSISGASGLITGGNSSPNTDSLTIGIVGYSSGAFSGTAFSGTLIFSNQLFNRYSGMIKMLGETYNNDQPNLLVTYSSGAGTFVSGQSLAYTASYLLSGWESDVVNIVTASIPSGANTVRLSWNPANEAVTHYAIWRQSGTGWGFGSQNWSGAVPWDLVALVSGQNSASFTDTNGVVLQSGYYKSIWTDQNAGVATPGSTTHYISSPYSTTFSLPYNSNSGFTLRLLPLKKTVSGNATVGPWFLIFHTLPGNNYQGGGTSIGAPETVNYQNLPPSATSGQTIVPFGPFNSVAQQVWTRYCFYFSGGGGTVNASGWVWFQAGRLNLLFNNAQNLVWWLDDTFIVAQS